MTYLPGYDQWKTTESFDPYDEPVEICPECNEQGDPRFIHDHGACPECSEKPPPNREEN